MNDIDCRECAELMPPALTGELDDISLVKFRRHLDSCESCGAEFSELRETWEMLDIPLPETRSAPALRPRLAAKPAWTSQFAGHAFTAVVIAAILLLLLLPFIYLSGRGKDPNVVRDRGEFAGEKMEPAEAMDNAGRYSDF